LSVYKCNICGYEYKDQDNIPFKVLSDDWICPICGAEKEQFMQIAEEQD